MKLWLYGTLAEPLFKSSFKTGGTARDIWLRIENQFRNNKEARAIQLDNELRTTEIGDMSLQEYCQKLKSLSDLLANVDAPVSDRTLVMYLLNGLNERFDNIINVIKHREPFPSFETAQSMLDLEEKRLKRFVKPSTTSSDKASTSTILTVEDQEDNTNKGQMKRSSNNNNYNNRGRRNNGGRSRGRNNNSRFQQQNWQPLNYWTPQFQQWQPQYPFWGGYVPAPQPQRGVLGPRPAMTHQANVTMDQPQLTTDYSQAFQTMTLADPTAADWYLDSGATSHMASSEGILKSKIIKDVNHSVIVGNGSRIPVTSSGNAILNTPSRSLSLNQVLITPQIVKNLISVRRFTKDNFCTVEFDPFGFSVKDLHTRKVLMRVNSSGDLNFVPAALSQASSTSSAFLSFSPDIWHKRLAHLNKNSLHSLRLSNLISCNNDSLSSSCVACQLGKQIKLPFSNSQTITTNPFELIHSDVWTSPIPSISGFRYYVLFLDDHTHFLWVFPLKRKSEVFSKFVQFNSYVNTQFKTQIQSLQCDNGGEYNNSHFHNFFVTKGIQVRFSCPHTSQQNGKSERMIRTINNSIRSLLFQAHLTPGYWVEALDVAVHVLNILPSI